MLNDIQILRVSIFLICVCVCRKSLQITQVNAVDVSESLITPSQCSSHNSSVQRHITLKMFVTDHVIPLFRIVYFKSCSEYLCIVVWIKGLCVCGSGCFSVCVSPQRSPSLCCCCISRNLNSFPCCCNVRCVCVNIWRVQLRVSHCSVALNSEWWGCIHGHVSISAPSVSVGKRQTLTAE